MNFLEYSLKSVNFGKRENADVYIFTFEVIDLKGKKESEIDILIDNTLGGFTAFMSGNVGCFMDSFEKYDLNFRNTINGLMEDDELIKASMRLGAAFMSCYEGDKGSDAIADYDGSIKAFLADAPNFVRV